jgi:chromosome partitioning protein
MYDARTNLAQEVAQEVRDHFPSEVLSAVIPRSVRISEAPSYGETVHAYDPGSIGALAYLEAAAEVAQRGTDEHRTDEHAVDQQGVDRQGVDKHRADQDSDGATISEGA